MLNYKLCLITLDSYRTNIIGKFKGQLQRFYNLMSYERAFKMLKNDVYH